MVSSAHSSALFAPKTSPTQRGRKTAAARVQLRITEAFRIVDIGNTRAAPSVQIAPEQIGGSVVTRGQDRYCVHVRRGRMRRLRGY